MSDSLHVQIDGLRYHRTPLGCLPGVTTVLSNTKSPRDKAGLARWKRKVGEAEAERIKQAACDRGSALHQAIENYLQEKPLDLESCYLPLFESVEPLLDQVQTIAHIEVPTYHPLGYGGSPDLIAEYKGHLTVLDWKTASKPKQRSYIKDYILQVCAYIQSSNWLFGYEIERGLIVVAVEGEPKCQTFAVTPKQYAKGRLEFQARLEAFQSNYSCNF